MKIIFILALLLSVIGVNAFAQSWLITGNSGTTPPSNFLGTIDAKPFVFKTNNSERMRIDKSGNVGIGITTPAARLDVEGGDAFINGLTIGKGGGQQIYNTATGYNALFSNTTGSQNTALGYEALYSNTTGLSNSAIGNIALFKNTTGTANTATGYATLYNNSTGSDNTADGYFSLFVNSSGSSNVGIGYYSLASNTTGFSNVAVGVGALQDNTVGWGMVAVGDSALFHQTTDQFGPYDNTAIGHKALYSNTDGANNTANGFEALYSNTEGSNNTANGFEALQYNTSGSHNTANGIAALEYNTSGEQNTACGEGALYLNTTGGANTAVGDNAGSNVSTGSANTFLGYYANSGLQGAGTNMTAIGNGATVTSSNHVVIGNSSVTSIGGYDNWTKLSDGRVKRNIKQNVPGLTFVNKLQPITYNLDLDAADKIIDRPAMKDKDAKAIQPSAEEIQARQAKEQVVYTGFIAQDVEKAAQSLNYDFSGVDKPDNANTLYGLRYGDFVVPLVKSVQELSKQNDSLKNDNATLHQQVNDLISRMNSVEQSLSQCCPSYQSSQENKNSLSTSDEARLEQNAPNPFSQNTTIQFHIPSSASDAMIVVSDLSGKTVQQFSHLKSGIGTVTLAGGALTSGTYRYSLILNGRVIDTKQMVITK